MAFSFPHILARLTVFRNRRPQPLASLFAGPEPPERSVSRKTESQKSKKKSVYVRKEFPETWLWTEEMVK